MFDILNAQVAAQAAALSALSARNVFPLWAEENGPLSANAYEWSWGNGSVGSTIGGVVPVACELIYSTFNSEVFGNSIGIQIERNGSTVATPVFNQNNSVVTVAAPIAFAAGDRASFRTGTLNGGFPDARIFTWFRPT